MCVVCNCTRDTPSSVYNALACGIILVAVKYGSLFSKTGKGAGKQVPPISCDNTIENRETWPEAMQLLTVSKQQLTDSASRDRLD
ncbi:hypothetical protein Y032_0014g2436 [Ancylostoma ceylanicum]|uniref:Uncharacterized protein n=1 Tax=Ancylostoma ceylanicum TaxID=53326 RepID=A0A016VB98_9BILA|nr:hypothetical protein Y032_0014g2436 [Ancylostoma ceylanicum]